MVQYFLINLKYVSSIVRFLYNKRKRTPMWKELNVGPNSSNYIFFSRGIV